MIQYEVDGRVATVTLNRPEKLNAITPELQRELLDALAGPPTTRRSTSPSCAAPVAASAPATT